MDSREKNVLGNLYMPDTNCFRYSAYIINKNDTSKREYKRAAIQFWGKIKIESEAEESTLLVSAEVSFVLVNVFSVLMIDRPAKSANALFAELLITILCSPVVNSELKSN